MSTATIAGTTVSSPSFLDSVSYPTECCSSLAAVQQLRFVRTHGNKSNERQATVDLQYHRLSPGSVLEICRRAPVTANLPGEVHQQVVDLSNGHPLALSYLLNRLRDADGEVASEVLAAAPAYAGDVAAEYRAVWDAVEDDDDILEILSVCSRLRISFTTAWVSSWAAPAALRKFRRRLLYLFREAPRWMAILP